MPYLPLALALTERFMASGTAGWTALLALCLGIEWTLGHFQIQTWTNALVLFLGLWRWVVDRASWRRPLGVFAATVWGAALAAVQLGLSWQFANLVGHTKRGAQRAALLPLPAGELV